MLTDLPPGPQLFLDDYFIESIKGVKRAMAAPRRHPEPVLSETDEYTHLCHAVGLYSSDGVGCIGDGRFRMWYFVRSPLGKSHAYAESVDGVHWEKPTLGLVAVNGSYENNLLPTAQCGATGYPITLLDNGPDFHDPSQRFMFLGCRLPDGGANLGAWAMFSADGIHLTSAPGNPVLPYEAWVWRENDQREKRRLFYDHMDVFYDPARRRYVYITGMLAQPEDGYVGRSRTGSIRRLIGQCESKDFLHWSTPRRIMAPQHSEDMTEFYNMSVLCRNGLYIGFPRILRDDLPADEGADVQGIGWTELAISRDGNNWTRLAGVFYDRSPNRNDFDHAMAWLRSPVYAHDEMWFYYWGYDEGHKVGKRQIGLARAKTDRFVALESQEAEPGRVATKVFGTACRRLSVNADADGGVRVRLLDSSGKVLPGYSFEDCCPVEGDAVAHPIRWKNQVELPDAKGSGIAIEIEIRRGSLYAVNLLG